MAQTYAAPASDIVYVDNPYEHNWPMAVIGGLTGTLIFSAAYAPIALVYQEQSLNLPLILGSFLTADPVLAQILGFGAHLANGVAIAFSYAIVMRRLRLQSDAGKGTIFGLLVFVPMFAFFLPWAVGLCARWGLPHVSLPMPDVMMNQAAHGNIGWEGPLLVAIAHMLYGFLLGMFYRHKLVRLDDRRRLRYHGD